jgi:hypothetical protein
MTSARNIGVKANVEAYLHTGFCSIAHVGLTVWLGCWSLFLSPSEPDQAIKFGGFRCAFAHFSSPVS